VRIDGRDFYLGKYDKDPTSPSRQEYDRKIAEWLANGRTLPRQTDDVTINELCPVYMRHVDAYYVKDGRPTSEPCIIRLSLKSMRALYGTTPAAEFGPVALKTVRKAFIDAGLCRTEVNRRTSQVVRFFRWLVENELVPVSVHHGEWTWGEWSIHRHARSENGALARRDAKEIRIRRMSPLVASSP
jgi:hypothetical protein